MSQKNVEVVRRLYALMGRPDDASWNLIPPEFVADFSRRHVEPAVLRGRNEVRAYWDHFLDAWEEAGLSNEPEELIDAGDTVVAFALVSGRGKASGAPVEVRVATVWTFREGRPVAAEYFGEDRAAALEAAGLSE
jgi:ketosteroid isomerase-like protein